MQVVAHADEAEVGAPDALGAVLETERRTQTVDVVEGDVAETADHEAHRLVAGQRRKAADVDAVHRGRVGIEDVEIKAEDVPAVDAPGQLDRRRKTDGDGSEADRTFLFLDFLCKRRGDRRQSERRKTDLEHTIHCFSFIRKNG